ncbi:N-acetyltransferase [Sneathiella marina]|uniref:N-acetyltransferase n=1 Tax=Sneathiella marina TaxID=2950108 RepID=A0ABY4W7H5_9PROT|nr:N-acetyltransferase [Sneathiella marina]USG61877.1 N-acetyltransferase [Sneathiella marina]
MPQIIHERPEDAAQIEPLLEKCFGPERFKKTAYKIRKKLKPIPELSFVIEESEKLLATIRYWPITIGIDTNALLLGPIAVDPERQGEGLGVSLIQKSLQVAQGLGHQIVILVGDPEYYEQFGFFSATKCNLSMPGPVEDRRFLVRELIPDSLFGVSGTVAGGTIGGKPAGRIASLQETSHKIDKLAPLAPPAET